MSISPDHPLFIFFSSGTTGQPKAVVHTNFAVLNCVANIYQHSGRFLSRLCVPVPIFHILGEVHGTLSIVIGPVCVIYPTYLPNTLATMKAIEEEQCTGIIGAAIIYHDLIKHPLRNEFNLKSLEYCAIAGSPISKEFLETIENELSIKYCTQAYGTTETAGYITNTIYAIDSNNQRQRLESIGKCEKFLEIKLIDDKDQIVPLGEKGELLMRGYKTMKGYWNDNEMTAKIITESKWLHTGDIAKMDEDGYLYFCGRKKEIIIRGGVNIYPLEIEKIIEEYPNILKAQVFGIPDERYGEIVCSMIVLKEEKTNININELKQFLSKHLAYFKIPKHIEVVDKFNTTASLGKVQKSKLAKDMIKILKSKL
ncbi:unnamed protein product [Didymodactylos carnosus]|nr:unnamed protein product [Didymodactylos carnosus]CAF4479492.1 unnamed protein product [Didymodactylos carnosus]